MKRSSRNTDSFKFNSSLPSTIYGWRPNIRKKKTSWNEIQLFHLSCSCEYNKTT